VSEPDGHRRDGSKKGNESPADDPSRTPSTTETRANVNSSIANRIAAATNWRMPSRYDGHSTARPIAVASKKPRRGVNVLALWITANAGDPINGLCPHPIASGSTKGAQVSKAEGRTNVVP
jgi:hypothetical protein